MTTVGDLAHKIQIRKLYVSSDECERRLSDDGIS